MPQLPVPKGAAMIYAPGNGDYLGFRIVVDGEGRATAIDGAGRMAGELRQPIADQLFADLEAAPNAASGAAPCPSAGVPVSENVTIKWSGRSWSGIRCASDARVQALADDARAVEHDLYVQAYRVRPMYVYLGANGPMAAQSGRVYGLAQYPAAYGGYSSQPFSSLGLNSSPYSGYPSGSMPSGSLPYATLTGSFPAGSLPIANIYSSLPTSGLPSSDPFGSSPYVGSPYGSGI